MSAAEKMPDPLERAAAPGPDGVALSVAAADVLGVELARAVLTQAETPGEGVAGFSTSLSLDGERLHVELIYLSILTTQFALSVALGAGESTARVIATFERALWAGAPWRASASGLEDRRREYIDAFNHPHPQLGRAYVIGRTFARYCGCSHEVAVIEFGARAYMGQLAPMLRLLRSVTLVHP
jgi:hypothetical protein